MESLPDTIDADNNGDTGGNKVVVNELLCYCAEYIQSCTKDQILKTVHDYYDIDEVVVAKKIL